ncbi:MAG TPA: outer membrane protein assembly factor BamA, partial [Thermomicrobiales bacterium]|nr:outer membrane protein assembly factor BamA [Thermomicrobiales bacterium]
MIGCLSPAFAESITVEGNHRVDAETIRSYFTGTDSAHVAEGVKGLKATGLFTSVRAQQGRGGLVVSVTENGIVNRVAFEGNSKVKSEVLQAEVLSKSRSAYDPAVVQADLDRIREVYRRAGRADATVTSRTVDLPNGKFDVVFTVDEGSKTGVKEITFAGNQAFSERKLRGLMQTTEMNLLSFFKTSDVYDPDKIATDEELIRRFDLRNGYADFRIVNTDVKFDAEQKGYLVKITVDEGQPYKVAAVSVDSHLRTVSSDELSPDLRMEVGDVYDGDQVEKTVDAITRDTGRRGLPFSQVRPRGDRNPANHTVSVQFVVDDGPRVYIERINIHGNTRTRDYVIRREFDVGEGDPYNKVLIDRAERRLNALGFFKKIRITNAPGSSPDRVIVDVDVEDQPTGSFSISGGYSTSDGFIAEVAVTETNFLGRGDYVRVAAQEGQYARGVDLSFTEPYLFDTRIAGGVDLFAKQNDNTQYTEYTTFVTGGTLRFGVPVTDEFSVSPHYSIYNTKITIPNKAGSAYDDCTFPLSGITPGYGGSSGA